MWPGNSGEYGAHFPAWEARGADASGGQPVPENLRVLIVEAVTPEADLGLAHLRQSGLTYSIRVAGSESALREALSEFQPHIVLADLTLPGLDAMRALDIVVREAP